MNIYLIIVCVGAMAALWKPADAVLCYYCNSDVTSTCNDPFSGTPQNCTGLSCGKAFGTVSGHQAIIRGCTTVSMPDTCTDYNFEGLNGKACYCNTALCNSASAVSFSHLAILLLATLIAVFEAIRG